MRGDAQMIRKISLLLIAIIVLAVLRSNDSALGRAGNKSIDDDAGIGGDFALTDQNGNLFQLSGQRGKIVLLFFGYTSCADACPAMMAKLTTVYKTLGASQKDVLTVFVSVDPARDTTAALKKYMEYFSIGAIGLTGKKEEIDRVVKQYGASYEIEQSDSAMGYHINHSTYLYLIDQSGEVKFKFKHTDRPAAIAAAVKQLMK
jgi:protein SCO1/2